MSTAPLPGDRPSLRFVHAQHACRVIYDPDTRDYALFLDDQLVGFARTESAGVTTLCELIATIDTNGLAEEWVAGLRTLIASTLTPEVCQ